MAITFIVDANAYVISGLLNVGLDRVGDGPQEACELTGNGRAHLHLDLAGPQQV